MEYDTEVHSLEDLEERDFQDAGDRAAYEADGTPIQKAKEGKIAEAVQCVNGNHIRFMTLHGRCYSCGAQDEALLKQLGK